MGQYSIQAPECRVSFWTGWDGKENDDGKLKFGAALLFAEGETLKALKDLGTQIMTDKFGTDKTKWPKGFHKPWRDQADHDPDNENRPDDKKAYAGYKSGSLFINCNGADEAPEVVDHNVKPILDRKQVYSGCFGIPQIDMFWFEYKNKNGVVMKKGLSTSLTHFMKTKDGEPLDNRVRPKAAEVFKPVAVDTKKGAAAVFAEDEEDPMA